MPTVLRWKGYRFFWYVGDRSEPPHVHIVKDGIECKIWLRSLAVAFNEGFSGSDLRLLVRKTSQEQQRFLEVWNEQFR